MKETFVVKSKNFSLLEAIKKEAEKMGWTYRSTFNEWSEKRLISGQSNCLCFATSWQTRPFGIPEPTSPQMSISTHSGSSKCYNLPEDWDEVLKALELPKEEEKKEAPKEVKEELSKEEVSRKIDEAVSMLRLLALLSSKIKK